MKHKFIIAMSALAFALGSCQERTESAYYDLNRDKDVDLVKDENGRMVDADTRQAPYIYINNETNDTIFGETGEVINGRVTRTADGKFKYDGVKIKYDEDGDFKLKDGDYKKKIDADGDIKIKDGDKKKKIDGETGEVKNK
jgi:hypothetical protein